MSLLLYLIPNFLFLLALSYVPLPPHMPAHNVMASTLSRLTVIGIVILGALSGFGAIDTAWDFFPVFSGNSRYASMPFEHAPDDRGPRSCAGLARRTKKSVLPRLACNVCVKTSRDVRRSFKRSRRPRYAQPHVRPEWLFTL